MLLLARLVTKPHFDLFMAEYFERVQLPVSLQEKRRSVSWLQMPTSAGCVNHYESASQLLKVPMAFQLLRAPRKMLIA